MTTKIFSDEWESWPEKELGEARARLFLLAEDTEDVAIRQVRV